LFPQNAANLGAAYSDGEKLLLAKTNALNVDPISATASPPMSARRTGSAFAQKVLYSGMGTAPAAAPAPAAAAAPAAPAARMPNAVLYEGTARRLRRR